MLKQEVNGILPPVLTGEENDENEEIEMEGGEMKDRDQSQRKTKQTKKIRVTTTAKNYLACGEECTARQSSVFYSLQYSVHSVQLGTTRSVRTCQMQSSKSCSCKGEMARLVP
jgi:hypothetical protein